MKKASIAEIIAYCVVALFLYTGISKLMDYDLSREQLALIPFFEPLAGTIALTLPILEIVTSIAMFLPATRRFGLWAALLLMFTFTSYIIFILSFDDQLPCTCGGILEQLTWPQHLFLNFGFIAIISIALWLSRARSIARIDHSEPLNNK